MKHRIYNKPFTRINEHWNTSNIFDSSPSESYCNPLITSKLGHYDISDLQPQLYNKIAIDILTETVYNYPYPQITEKTLRPLSTKRMFILVGAPFTLQFLKDKGFKTFSPFINEEYDIIIDPHKRLQFIINEIKRICNIPLPEIKNILINYKNILEHNFTTLKNLVDTESKELEILLDNL